MDSSGEGKLISHGRRWSSSFKGIAIGSLTTVAQGSLMFLGAILTDLAVNFSNKNEMLSHITRRSSLKIESNPVNLHIPSALDQSARRSLSLNLGGGNCK